MKLIHLTTSILTLGLLAGCSGADTAADKAVKAASETASVAKGAVKQAANKPGRGEAPRLSSGKTSAPGVDVSGLPSGTYKSEAGHAYISFSYDHRGFSRPILRWGSFDAVVNLDSQAPANSTVTAEIDVASIDSGVEIFDKHLVGADWFDAANHPKITFSSTEVNQITTGRGTLTGDLTIKGVTQPVVLTTKLNKIGQNFRSKKDMFGISATAHVKRADFGIDKHISTAPDIAIKLEIEFQKEE